MSKPKPPRKLLGHIALWIFRAYSLFFIVEIYRFYQGVKQFHPTAENELATNVGIAAGGVIVFVPLLIVGALLFLFSWLTRGKPGNEADVKHVQ
ncbi:MAG: hypothetical protein ACRCT4_01060 [Silvania sp.]